MGLGLGVGLGTTILTGQLAIWISLGMIFGACADAMGPNKANDPQPPPSNVRRLRR
jgi:hypothetical protein